MDTRICSHFIWVTSVGLHLSAKLLVYLLSCSSVHASCCSQCCTSELVGSLFARWRKRFDVCWSGERLVNSAKDLLTVAWDVAPQGLTQRPPPPPACVALDCHSHFPCPDRDSPPVCSNLKSTFLRRLWRAGLSAAQRTDLGTQRRLHEVVRGPHACLFCRLHLPTSSCLNLRRNKISDRGGGLISAERTRPRGRTVRGTVLHYRLLPYRPPSGGGTIRNIS